MIFLKNDMHIFGTMTNKDFRADKKKRSSQIQHVCSITEMYFCIHVDLIHF